MLMLAALAASPQAIQAVVTSVRDTRVCADPALKTGLERPTGSHPPARFRRAPQAAAGALLKL